MQNQVDNERDTGVVYGAYRGTWGFTGSINQ